MWLIIEENNEDWYSIVEMATNEIEARKDAVELTQEKGSKHWVVFMDWGSAYEKK